MATILFVEDQGKQREEVTEILTKAHHEVNFLFGIKTSDLVNEFTKWLKKKHPTIDILILDIVFADDRLGGLKLYNELEEQGLLHNRFDHLIILTQLLKTGTKEEKQTVQDFMISKHFPAQNLVSRTPTYDILLKRIAELTGKQ